jgi:hypothetical protein
MSRSISQRLDAIERRLAALEKVAHPQIVMTEKRATEIIERAVRTAQRRPDIRVVREGPIRLC